MNIDKLSKEELENMSYDDIAFELLTKNKHQMKIIDLFNKVGELIGLSKDNIEDEIGDFFEMLTTDKRFIMLDDGSWDLKSRHVQNIIIEEDDDEVIPEDVNEIIEDEEEDIFYDEENDDDDDKDEDLKDLVVIDEDEEESM